MHISEAPPAVVIQAKIPDQHGGKALWFFANGRLVREWTLDGVFDLLPREAPKTIPGIASPVIQLGPVEWNREQAVVPGKAFRTEDRINYASHKYVLALKDGKWTVIGQQTGY